MSKTILKKFLFFLFLCHSIVFSDSKLELSHLIYSTISNVDSGNFTYYNLRKGGHLKVWLTSKEGDADLYISSNSMKPDYNNYQFKSTTCGDDEVDISSSMKRPVTLGIFGHPGRFETNTFELKIYYLGAFSPDDYQEYYKTSNNDDDMTNEDEYQNENQEEESESFMWTIFLNILHLLLDILL